MGGRATRSLIALLLIGVLLVCAACTRPKPREAEAEKETTSQEETVVPTIQPPPGQTVISVWETPTETPTPALMPTPEVPVVSWPTTTPLPTIPVIVPTSTPEEAPVPPESSTTHIVQRGESLYSIGQQYGIPWQEVAQVNGITPPYRIVVGQKLIIRRGGAPVEPSEERIHIVQPGENLFRIGLRYGVTWQDIAQANGIVNPSQVFVGQRLVIP
jgi:LysM repeat protein